ncbi:hypothetical protein [Alphaproteobacteria bacterium endosymbiont of Tiliacea citrago]|uniref:hypothetical protein n=1 Tax=Alphaproteobacteria bacterium endosymbiont of Tiliacea citrago TaxID=3077944 RepID=UPI00313D7762
MLEEKITRLVENRKKINSSLSFKEISAVWTDVKKEHEECKQELKLILDEIDSFNKEVVLDKPLPEDFDFDFAFNKIKDISENIKKCTASDFAKNIKELSELKQQCFQFLSQEKAKIEEVEL